MAKIIKKRKFYAALATATPTFDDRSWEYLCVRDREEIKMKEKDWELILNAGRQRVYKLNFKVRYFKRPDEELAPIKEAFDYNICLPEHLEIIDDTETIDKVCVSDAHSHVERLVKTL